MTTENGKNHVRDDDGLSDKFKISSRGTHEAHEILNRLAEIGSLTEARDIYGRRLSKASVINAIILWFGTRSRSDQSEYLTDGIRMLKGVIEGKGMPQASPTAETKASIRGRNVSGSRGGSSGK